MLAVLLLLVALPVLVTSPALAGPSKAPSPDILSQAAAGGAPAACELRVIARSDVPIPATGRLPVAVLDNTGSIAGRVTDAASRGPIAYANVVLMETKLGSITLDDGTYSITGVPAGTYTVTVKTTWTRYEAISRAGITVLPGKVATAGFELTPTPNAERVFVELPTDNVLEGFHLRAKATPLAGADERRCRCDQLVMLPPSSKAVDPAADPVTAPAAPRFALAQNRPNPFRGATEIDFELPARSAVKLRIYDVTGRLVRAVLDETREMGSQVAIWDGRDHAERPVGSGIYFYRLEAEDRTETRQLVVLR